MIASRQPPTHDRLATILLAAIGFIDGEARAQVFDFVGNLSSNVYELGTNWSPLGPPGMNDTARFDQNFPYTVLFNSSPTNAALAINDGDVVFRPLGSGAGTETYTITGDAAVDGDIFTHLSLTDSGLRPFLLDVGGTFFVGNLFNGRLTVEPGASLTSDSGVIAASASFTGKATVDGSTRINSGDLTVGERGNGTLTLKAAARYRIRPAALAMNSTAPVR